MSWVRVPADHRLLVGILAVLAPLRVAQTVHLRWMSVDGGYYTEVARNVRDGDGLQSMESLYHFGYPYFPFPTSVYPLWPVVLGLAARLGPLDVLAHWLPFALSFAALFAAYGWGRRLWPDELFPRSVPGFHAGHLFVIGLSVHSQWIENCSLPYTEPLAWSLLFGFLWRSSIRGDDRSVGWGVETGLWLAALYFARFQFLNAPIAAACAIAVRVVVGPDRVRTVGYGAIALGVCGTLLGAWLVHLEGFVDHASVGTLLRFDQNRANDLLLPVDVIVQTHGALDLLVDRARGVLVAWDPGTEAGYQNAFQTLHWALPAALPLLAMALRDVWRRDGFRGVWERLRSPEAAPWIFLVIFAFGALLSVHLVHKTFAGSWYFARRQGLMALPAFVLPLAWLLRQERPTGRVLGVLILSSSLALGLRAQWKEAVQTGGELREHDRYHDLVHWLEDRASEHPCTGSGPGVVVVMDAYLLQRIGWRTDRVGYHWIAGRSGYEDLLAMTDQLGAQYVIFRPQAESGFQIFQQDRCRFDRDFVRLPDAPSGEQVYQRTGRDPTAEPIWDWTPPQNDPGDCTASSFAARRSLRGGADAEADETP